MNHKILLLSSSIFYILHKSLFKKDKIFSILILFLFISSQLFWINPIKYSLIHKIDAFIVRIVGFFIITKFLTIRKNFLKTIIFSFIIVLLIVSCVYSDYFSINF